MPPTCTAATCPTRPHHTAAKARERGGSACHRPPRDIDHRPEGRGWARRADRRGVLGRQRPRQGPGEWTCLGCASGEQSRRALLGWSPAYAAGSRASMLGVGLAAKTATKVLPAPLPRVWVQEPHGRHQSNPGSNRSTLSPQMPCPGPAPHPPEACRSLLVCAQGVCLSCTWSLRLF